MIIEEELRNILTTDGRSECERKIRAATRFVGLNDKKVLCTILGKYKFFVSPDDVGFTPHMIFDGYWEFWLTQFMARTVKAGSSALDIGANYGYYSLLLSELVGTEGKVGAVEANPYVAQFLTDNLSINGFAGRSKVWTLALDDVPKAGRTKFFVPHGEPKNGRLLSPGEKSAKLTPYGQVMDVATGRLDLSEFDQLDFIKIDVEGAELRVLRAIEPVIKHFNPQIICEVNFSRGYSFDDAHSHLGNKNKMHHLDFDGGIKELTRSMAAVERVGDDWLVFRDRV